MGSKWAQLGSKWAYLGSKWAQLGSKLAQFCSKLVWEMLGGLLGDLWEAIESFGKMAEMKMMKMKMKSKTKKRPSLKGSWPLKNAINRK